MLFHDWVGTLFALTYTLVGFFLMLYLILPSATARASDVSGRAHRQRPSSLAQAPGLFTGQLKNPALAAWPGILARGADALRTASWRRGRLAAPAGGLADTGAGTWTPTSGSAAVAGRPQKLGLATTAPSLLAVRAEKDPAVLAAVIETVAGRQWEPASTGRSGAAALGPGTTWTPTPRTPGPPRTAPSRSSAGIAGATTPPSLDPARSARFQRGADVATEESSGRGPASRPPTPTRCTAPPSWSPASGGAAGVAVCARLQARGHRVVGVDADPDAVGLILADEAHVVPRGDDPHFLAALLRVVTVSSAQAMICTVAEEYAAVRRQGGPSTRPGSAR